METNTQEERLREPMFFGAPEPLLEPNPAEQEQLLRQETAANPILKAKIAEPRNARMALSAVSTPARQEHYGTEPPGPGWTNAGPMKWVKDGSGGTPKVAIVGGGPAGLFAAYILQQRLPEAGITIFEASSRLGGKIQTASFGDGTPFEAGVAELYEYKGGKADPLRALIEYDLGLTTVNMSGGGVVLRGKVLRDLADLEKEFGKKTRKAVEKFHEKCAELMTLKQYSQRWQPDNSHPWANKTFRECIEEELGDDEAAMDYVETACASDLAIESRSCNGLNGIKNVLLDNAEYMQLYHVIGGIERLSNSLISIVNVYVRLTTRVVSIAKHEESYRVNYQHDGRDEVEDFDYVILAMPNHWLTQLRFEEPELKEAIRDFLAHYDAPAHYFRATMLFDKPWWDRFNFPGEFWMMDLCNGCCAYDESKRWGRKSGGRVLSFLLAGTDALLMCSGNQSPSEIAQHVLDGLPSDWRDEARSSLLECRMDTWAGSICAQPGGWPAAELRQEHQPEPEEHPGILLVCDSLFDSTLNGALISANVAVELLLEQAELEGQPATKAIEALASDKKGL